MSLLARFFTKPRTGTILFNALKYNRNFVHKKCAEPKTPECEEPKDKGCFKLNCGNASGLTKKSPCKETKKPKKKKESKKKLISVWGAECNTDICPDPPPKFDSLYYKPKNFRTRKYQQTWVDCPRVKKVVKKLCEYPYTEKDPPLPRRSKKEPKPKTACALMSSKSGLMECEVRDAKNACVKIKMPGCGTVRNPPACKTYRGPKDCEKIKCPTNSFSECNKPKPKKLHPTECNCLKVRSMCEIYKIAKKKQIK